MLQGQGSCVSWSFCAARAASLFTNSHYTLRNIGREEFLVYRFTRSTLNPCSYWIFILFYSLSLSLSLSSSFRFSYTLREATALPKSHDDIPVGRHTSAIWRPCLCSVQKHAESFDKRLVDHEQYMVMTIVVLRTRRLLAIGLTT